MFSRISRLITDELVKDKTIEQTERELYEYGFRQGFTALLNVFTTLAIGLLFGCPMQSIAFLLLYIPLRSFAGGYHAKTPVMCYFQSVLMLILISLGFRYLELKNYSICLIILSSIIIIVLSPVEDSNKPLDEKEIVIYKKRTLVVWAAELSLYIFFETIDMVKYSVVFTYVFGIMGLMLLLGKMKNYINKKKAK